MSKLAEFIAEAMGQLGTLESLIGGSRGPRPWHENKRRVRAHRRRRKLARRGLRAMQRTRAARGQNRRTGA